LERCRKGRAGVMCSLSAYNSTDYDKTFMYSGGHDDTFIIDSEANKYPVERTSNPSYNIMITLPPKTTKKLSLLFRPTGKLTNDIKVLQMSTKIEKVFVKSSFRDIKIDS
jgi:hypothetical protein